MGPHLTPRDPTCLMWQVTFFGLLAEALGAMTLGSLVAKTISKGVLDPDIFDAEGCAGVLRFGVSMACVLAGTGITTLGATLYAEPVAQLSLGGGCASAPYVASGPRG